MDKPEWCSADIWSDALQVASPLPIGDLGQKTLAREVAKAILSAQSQAYKDAARIAEKCGETELSWANMELPVSPGPVIAKDRARVASRISAAILQRKEEMK